MRKRVARFLIEEKLYQVARQIAERKYVTNFSEYMRLLIRRDMTQCVPVDPAEERPRTDVQVD